MIKTTAQKIYIALIFIFMYAPIATLVVLSFNASKTRAKWGGFTTKWYTQLFSNSEIMQALYNTLLIALLSAVFATLIGTIAALSIQGMKKKSRAVLMTPVFSRSVCHARVRRRKFIHMGRMKIRTIKLCWLTCLPARIMARG